MKDIKLNADHDIAIEFKDFRLLEDFDVVAQSLEIRLKMFLGEYLLKSYAGFPYYDVFLGQKPDIEFAKGMVIFEIEKEAGVERVNEFNIYFKPSDRTVYIEFDVLTRELEEIHKILRIEL